MKKNRREFLVGTNLVPINKTLTDSQGEQNCLRLSGWNGWGPINMSTTVWDVVPQDEGNWGRDDLGDLWTLILLYHLDADESEFTARALSVTCIGLHSLLGELCIWEQFYRHHFAADFHPSVPENQRLFSRFTDVQYNPTWSELMKVCDESVWKIPGAVSYCVPSTMISRQFGGIKNLPGFTEIPYDCFNYFFSNYHEEPDYSIVSQMWSPNLMRPFYKKNFSPQDCDDGWREAYCVLFLFSENLSLPYHLCSFVV